MSDLITSIVIGGLLALAILSAPVAAGPARPVVAPDCFAQIPQVGFVRCRDTAVAMAAREA